MPWLALQSEVAKPNSTPNPSCLGSPEVRDFTCSLMMSRPPPGSKPSIAARWSDTVRGSANKPYSEISAVMAGKIASSEKNVTPAASVMIRSVEICAATRFSIAHHPAGGISVGRAASRPWPVRPVCSSGPCNSCDSGVLGRFADVVGLGKRKPTIPRSPTRTGWSSLLRTAIRIPIEQYFAPMEATRFVPISTDNYVQSRL